MYFYPMETLNRNKKIILFDGVCNLCNGAVQFVIRRDNSHQFVFASLQSRVGQQLIQERRINTAELDSRDHTSIFFPEPSVPVPGYQVVEGITDRPGYPFKDGE